MAVNYGGIELNAYYLTAHDGSPPVDPATSRSTGANAAPHPSPPPRYPECRSVNVGAYSPTTLINAPAPAFRSPVHIHRRNAGRVVLRRAAHHVSRRLLEKTALTGSTEGAARAFPEGSFSSRLQPPRRKRNAAPRVAPFSLIGKLRKYDIN